MLAGVDIGGTFTDLVLLHDGRLLIHKLPTTPGDPAAAMLEGLDQITGSQIAALKHVVHGSTVATNAILERKGARIALITTRGFRDILFIARQNRPQLYALQPQLSEPLIPRERCFEVPERLDFNGNVLQPLDLSELDRVLDQIASADIACVAVCFLYSNIFPEHERQVRQRIIERGLLEDWQVALSSDVLPEFREYERASTVALEAYVRPVMGKYITNLDAKLRQRTQSLSLRVMKSDGGIMSGATVRKQAIQTALSGPAAGVIGAFHLAQLAGFDHIITLDMGGTSTDVSICPGQPLYSPQSEMDGLPLRIRTLDIETVGAGGGSIARIDFGGALRVGPESAGAVPGPAIYGKGGKAPTVSDANAILGRLVPEYFLGGQMTLHLEQGHAAVQKLAQTLKMHVADTARGILDVATVNIDRAVRRVSVARGYDPRQFVLVAFGGAGALHACDVATRLQIRRVLVPRYPGVLCALGLLVADVVRDYSRSLLETVNDGTIEYLALLLEEIITQARDDLKAEDIPRDNRHYIASLDMRYQGQAYELNVPADGTVDLRDLFHETHHRTYGHSIPERTVELVNLRLRAVGTVQHPMLEAEPVKRHHAEAIGENATPDGVLLMYYEREHMGPGAHFQGPALVFQLDSTTYLPPGWSGEVDGYRNLILSHTI